MELSEKNSSCTQKRQNTKENYCNIRYSWHEILLNHLHFISEVPTGIATVQALYFVFVSYLSSDEVKFRIALHTSRTLENSTN